MYLMWFVSFFVFASVCSKNRYNIYLKGWKFDFQFDEDCTERNNRNVGTIAINNKCNEHINFSTWILYRRKQMPYFKTRSHIAWHNFIADIFKLPEHW